MGARNGQQEPLIEEEDKTSQKTVVESVFKYKKEANSYVTVGKSKNMNFCRQFIKDFPYSLFKQRRKDPDTKMHVLVGRY